jgi:RNA polymerase sigma-70 factor (ECF subfamily)
VSPARALPVEDAELLQAVLRKDRKATAAFVDRYADAVYSYVRHRLLPSTDLVDDLVQEVFLAAWERLGEFRGDSSLRGWLLGIARHKVQDYYRGRLSAACSLDSFESPDAGPEAASPAPFPDEVIDQARLQERTQRILAELPEMYSLALMWRYWEGRSAAEMAAETGRTEKAVERLLARAREQFKRRWKDA